MCVWGGGQHLRFFVLRVVVKYKYSREGAAETGEGTGGQGGCFSELAECGLFFQHFEVVRLCV